MAIDRRDFLRMLPLAGAGFGIHGFLKSCTRIYDANPENDCNVDNLVHYAFRLTDHNSLLNLEYYFINCIYDRNNEKIIAKYGPHENYMIVRLPQQHIAEQNFSSGHNGPFNAATYISGYSYLVFRLLFPVDPIFSFDENSNSRLNTLEDGKTTYIKLRKKDLLDWNNERKFRLVVRQDLTESLFELKKVQFYYESGPQVISELDKKIDSLKSKNTNNELNSQIDTLINQKDTLLENHYPFQTRRSLSPHKDKFDINLIPRVYGDPVTAIELPWRLIISPRLPDSSKYKFKWDIPETNIVKSKKDNDQEINKEDCGKHKLWTATLSITERTDADYLSRRDHIRDKGNENSSNGLNSLINQLELMILGSPDFPTHYSTQAGTNTTFENILPTSLHRKDLVALYIKLKVLARTDKLTFSSIGATAHIHLKNEKFEAALKKGIGVIEWDQIISLGRDEKVEVSTLFLEAEFGHKMAYIQITERKVRKGFYPLILKSYLMPIDITRDYTNHVTIDSNEGKKIQSRFNSPFKKITFLETKPKELVNKDYKQTTINYTETSFEFEAIDWQDNIVKFKKKISAIPFGAVVDFGPLDPRNPDDSKKTKIQEIISDTTKVFTPDNAINDSNPYLDSEASLPIIKTEVLDSKLTENNIKKNLNALDSLILHQNKIYNEFIKETSSVLGDVEEYIIEESRNHLEEIYKVLKNEYLAKFITDRNILTIKLFINILLEKKLFSQKIFIAILNSYSKLDNYAKWSVESFYDYLSSVSFDLSKDFIFKKIRIDSPEYSKIILSLIDFSKKLDNNKATIIKGLESRLQILIDIENKAKNIPNIVLLQKQKIGYAIKEKIDEAQQRISNELEKDSRLIKKSLSELESEYIIFKGALRQTETQLFDFFHEYAIIPEVEQAKIYVSTLSKLIDQDFPISIKYAEDYLKNQVRDVAFEIKQNTAMVFGKVLQSSREEIKGIMQKISDKMPGFNVEVPAHYLTYLRNPNLVRQDIIGKFIDDKTKADVENFSKDLIFISEDVKSAIKTIEDFRNVDPKMYFKDLGAKLFGSIRLEDILGVGFDMPRITELPDKIIYQFSNDKFVEHRNAFVLFKPNASADQNNQTKLDLFISKNLKQVNDYYAFTQLNNFSVGVIIGNAEVLTVTFDQFKITSSSNKPKQTDISVSNVKLGGPLEFIADLAKKFMAPGNGMTIKPGPKNLSLDYTIQFPDVKSPAFNFRNLQLVVGLNIPYDPDSLKPITFNFGVNKPEDKFLVSAGIYGGRGHFTLRATPTGIEYIDIAIEMGAYASIDLGIGKGEVFLFFGFWFVCGKDNNNNNLIKAVAYVICSGSATVLGFISIGVSVLISLTYIKRGEAALFFGEAIVTYSVKIAFFKKEFSIRYYKEIAGSGQGNGTRSTAGMILLDYGLPGMYHHVNKNNNERVLFTDVFANESELEEYVNCFM